MVIVVVAGWRRGGSHLAIYLSSLGRSHDGRMSVEVGGRKMRRKDERDELEILEKKKKKGRERGRYKDEPCGRE